MDSKLSLLEANAVAAKSLLLDFRTPRLGPGEALASVVFDLSLSEDLLLLLFFLSSVVPLTADASSHSGENPEDNVSWAVSAVLVLDDMERSSVLELFLELFLDSFLVVFFLASALWLCLEM